MTKVNEERGSSQSFRIAVANFVATLGEQIALHSADPGDTGANEIAGTRSAVTWNDAVVVAGGARITANQISFFVPGATKVSHFSVRDGSGNFLFSGVLSPVLTANAAGHLLVTASYTFNS